MASSRSAVDANDATWCDAIVTSLATNRNESLRRHEGGRRPLLDEALLVAGPGPVPEVVHRRAVEALKPEK